MSVLICGLGVLAALVPVGHGFSPKGGGWFRPEVVGGAFTLYPLFIAVPSAACFVLGLLDWRRPWRVEHLDLLALAGFFPVAMLLSDDASRVGLWLAAACLGWLFCRMVGAAFGIWQMPELCPSHPMLRPPVQDARKDAALAAALLIGAPSYHQPLLSAVRAPFVASDATGWTVRDAGRLLTAFPRPGPHWRSCGHVVGR